MYLTSGDNNSLIGQTVMGSHYQNSYTQTGSYVHISNLTSNNSGHVISGGVNVNRQLTCPSAMDCESPLSSSSGLATFSHQITSESSTLTGSSSKPGVPTSITVTPNTVSSSTNYYHSHHQRINHNNAPTSSDLNNFFL